MIDFEVMSTALTLSLFVLGLVAGFFGGMFGIGGGLIIVPALMYFMKLPLVDSSGTSVAAQLLPVGLLGAIAYYQSGHVRMVYAALIAAGLFIGFFFGAKTMIGLDAATAKRVYALFLIAIGTRMLFTGK